MATLELVQFDNGVFALQGRGDSSRNADFSFYDVDGEYTDPLSFGNIQWKVVEGVDSADYDPDDDYDESFWDALAAVITSARKAGIPLSE